MKTIVLNAIKALAVLIACLCIHPISAQVEHVVKLGTGIMSLEAIDSYPQKLLEIIENSDTAVIVRISTFNEWEDVQTVNNLRYAPYVASKTYENKLQKYLKPTAFVNSESESTRHLADSIFSGNEKTVVEIIRKALAVSSSLKFDELLAQRIYNGDVSCMSSDYSLETMMGTCSECTNIFLALMRNRNIPARFVRGMVFNQGSMTFHAWAEVWFNGFGWWAVDPQTGNEMTPYYFYKLHAGADSLECGCNSLRSYRFRNGGLIIEEQTVKYQF